MRLVSLLVICCLVAAADARAASDTAVRRPNIVFFLCDDLGMGDIAALGSKQIRTPNIDRLAKQGTRFTSFYVAQAVCSASRAALLTGCYANRVGIHGALGPKQKIGLHPDETTTISGTAVFTAFATRSSRDAASRT